MLQITVPRREYFDENKQEFITYPQQVLTLEHSLVSISKWESKWKKPFLSKDPKTYEESCDYIRCMVVNQKNNNESYIGFDSEIFNQVSAYINDSMTATWFNENNVNKGRNSQIVTSELIYYWMIAFNIPFECQKWHLNRLLTLIKICEIKNTPSKKMSQKDIYARNRALNAARKRNLNTNG